MSRKSRISSPVTDKTTVSSLGEFPLITHLAQIIGVAPNSVYSGIGDDAAVIKPSGKDALVFTTDALTEGVHFDLAYDTPYKVGWKSMVASLSDIAAMNATPVAAVIAIALPPKTKRKVLFNLYKGVREAAHTFKCPIVGGDTTSSASEIFISVAMIGRVPAKHAVYRSGAKPGDIVCVTGDLGKCHAALQLMHSKHRVSLNRKLTTVIMHKHDHPIPRFDVLAKLQRRNILPTALIDISDGLSSELHHITDASKVGIEINVSKIPVDISVNYLAGIAKEDPLKWAVMSGEEYELLFTVDPRHADTVARMRDITVIGNVRKQPGVWIRNSNNTREKLLATGWKHF